MSTSDTLASYGYDGLTDAELIAMTMNNMRDDGSPDRPSGFTRALMTELCKRLPVDGETIVTEAPDDERTLKPHTRDLLIHYLAETVGALAELTLADPANVEDVEGWRSMLMDASSVLRDVAVGSFGELIDDLHEEATNG